MFLFTETKKCVSDGSPEVLLQVLEQSEQNLEASVQLAAGGRAIAMGGRSDL